MPSVKVTLLRDVLKLLFIKSGSLWGQGNGGLSLRGGVMHERDLVYDKTRCCGLWDTLSAHQTHM